MPVEATRRVRGESKVKVWKSDPSKSDLCIYSSLPASITKHSPSRTPAASQRMCRVNRESPSQVQHFPDSRAGTHESAPCSVKTICSFTRDPGIQATGKAEPSLACPDLAPAAKSPGTLIIRLGKAEPSGKPSRTWHPDPLALPPRPGRPSAHTGAAPPPARALPPHRAPKRADG